MEPFFRGKTAQQGHPGGTGLGLAIIKTSMERNGGEAFCSNVEPHGFRVTLKMSRCLDVECGDLR